MSMDTVNEGSTAYLVAAFLNRNGVAEAPDTISYSVRDLYSGTELRANTAVTPAATVEIELTPTDNRILAKSYAREMRVVKVIATFGVGDTITSVHRYWVRNVAAVQLS